MKPIVKSKVKKEPTITKETARRNIAQWLYVYDGSYMTKNEWRKELIAMLDWNIKHIKE